MDAIGDSWWSDDYVWNRDTDEVRRCRSREEALSSYDKTVARDTVTVDGIDYLVSTVFLRLDHGYHGVPVVFETMVFQPDADHPWRSTYQERYSYPEQARRGHALAVEWVKRKGWEDKDDE